MNELRRSMAPSDGRASAARGRWPRSLRLLLAGCVAVPLAVLGFWADRTWRAELGRATGEALRNAELVREHALGVIRTQESILDHAASLAAAADEDGADLEEMHRRLAALNAKHPSVLSIGVINRDGVVFVSSRTHPVRLDVSDRDYFRRPRDGDGSLQIARLILRPGGQDVVILARRRPGADFSGVLLATIPVEAFTRFFGRIAADSRASASLLREDGLLLVRHTPSDPPVVLPADVPARSAIASAESGTYRALALSDGVERVYGFARLEGLPLFANFGVGLDSVRAAWLRELVLVGGLLMLASLLGCAAVVQAARGMRAEVDRGLLAEAERRAAYQDTLLRELHHRVKNSLMTVQSLISIRVRGEDGDRVLRQRVMALAQVHDLLHVSEFVSRLDLAVFLRALCANPAIVPPERGVTVTCDVEAVEVAVEQAVPLSLIVVELLTNALKHGFPDGRSGHIEVSLRRDGASALLTVRDDGIGLPGLGTRSRTSGLHLVNRLVTQLQGQLQAANEAGAVFRLAFPVPGIYAG